MQQGKISPRVLLGLGFLGIAARAWIWRHSTGANDVPIWSLHAYSIYFQGLANTYRNSREFNHPPLMGYYALYVWRYAPTNLHKFAHLIKLPGLLGEVMILLTLWRLRGLKAFAAYACLPVAILVSSFHGNTDCLCAGLALLTVVAFSRKKYFLAGVFWGGSLNVKLIPLIFVPVFLVAPPKLRDGIRLWGGASLGLIPFIPPALSAASAMYRNMIRYHPIPDNWGVTALLHSCFETRFASTCSMWRSWYIDYGSFVVMGTILALALACRFRLHVSIEEQAAIAASIFLILAPGFGVQYLVFPAPLFCLVDLGAALLWGWISGIYIAVVYLTFLVSWRPLNSYFSTFFFPGPAALLSMLAWAALINFVWTHVRLRTSLGANDVPPG